MYWARTLAGLFGALDVEVVDLLKVDIEGAEIALIDAADDATLRRCCQMTIEFHDFMDPDQAVNVKRQLDRFESLGFDCVVMTRRHHGDVWVVNRAALCSVLRNYFTTNGAKVRTRRKPYAESDTGVHC